jgi:CubicO group peptidase (beta-lactamase class C family)
MATVRLASLVLVGVLAACTAPLPVARDRDQQRSGPTKGETGAGAPDDGSPAAPDPAPPSSSSCGAAPTAAVDTTALDPFFLAKMKAANVPGLSVAVVGGGRIKWAKSYGLADIAAGKPVTNDTLFMLASVSKTVTSVALMQLLEDPARGLSLDQDVNGKLPFSVRNPKFPSTPITYRMLLTHTSTLVDSDGYWAIAEPNPLPRGDSPIALLDFERDYVPRADSWSSSPPGSAYEYSNTGAALLGLLVETISGKNLDEYAKANIFDRLGMKEASFFLRNLDASHVAIPYEQVTPLVHYGYPDYPAGQLRTSAPQLARFLLMFAQKGQCGQRVLTEQTVATMRTVQLPSVAAGQGLIWYYAEQAGTNVLGHRGGDRGVSTDMFFDPTTGSGYVLLANGSTNTSGVASEEAAMTAMDDKLVELAKTLP